MNRAEYEKAMENSLTPGFTEDEASTILEWEYGRREVIVRMASDCCSVGVIRAIEKLGGKYQAGWGITRMPNWPR